MRRGSFAEQAARIVGWVLDSPRPVDAETLAMWDGTGKVVGKRVADPAAEAQRSIASPRSYARAKSSKVRKGNRAAISSPLSRASESHASKTAANSEMFAVQPSRTSTPSDHRDADNDPSSATALCIRRSPRALSLQRAYGSGQETRTAEPIWSSSRCREAERPSGRCRLRKRNMSRPAKRPAP